MKKHVLSSLCTPLLLLTFSCIFGGPMQVEARVHISTWQIVASPNGPLQQNMLNGVVAISASDVWAVGDDNGGSVASPHQALIEHWNGTAWSIVPAAMTLYSSLDAVTQIPHTRQLWAVGDYITGGSDQPLAEHWNGKQWSVVPTPLFGRSVEGNAFTSVSALSPNDAWAAGVYVTGQGQGQTALIEHWNGTQWEAMAVPTPIGTSSYFNSIVALSAKNVWAVGAANFSGGGESVLIDHWNGTAWSLVTAPSPGNSANILYSVTRIPDTNQLWAVGAYGKNGEDQTLIERWDGKQWLLVASPSLGSVFDSLQSVVSITPGDAWAVGYSFGTGVSEQPLIEHWNGTAWSLVASPTPSNVVGLSSVISIPHTRHLWTVGSYSNNHITDQFTLTELYH